MKARAAGNGPSIDGGGIPRLLMTVPEVAAALCIGRSAAYELLRSGLIESVKIGKSRRVTVKALQEYIARLEEEHRLERAS